MQILIGILFCLSVSSPPAFAKSAANPSHAQAGFLITEIKPGSVYEKLGLQNGDLLQSYNGKPLKNEKDVQGLLEKLKENGTIKLNLERKGKSQVMTYKIEQK